MDGDFNVFESTIILEYIKDKYHDVPPRPADPKARAKARMIEDVCDSQFEPINWAMGEIKAFKRAEDEKAEEIIKQAKHQIKQAHVCLTEQLGDAQWFGGDKFGWADLSGWPVINRSTSYGLEPEPGTALRDWYERAKGRESVKSVFEEFLAATKTPAPLAEWLNNGLLIRQYRDHRLEWMIKSGGIDIVAAGLEKKNIRFQWPNPLE
ncbi:uncharacterized protein A1O9_05256 [Exophiala aquamarina CBS 119918]|uniref:GST C-terminal domain-containing protein n=1 Tax=Exophiala aquamarina CBS 119918 TaxID=1182545 RepID=A0A072PB78_9EURO|nr:uncharacterized protein A1O9_05256 [Exophiala aquamarina CBS 119918]KEF57339.1 hypothetical protein A1O9_05256 [Exophiala aquamarina CBS 119918]